MRPAVIEPRANEDARLTPWADPEELLEQFGFDGEPPRREGSKGIREVDAVGFEPTASPLQGERSTADLRARSAGDISEPTSLLE